MNDTQKYHYLLGRIQEAIESLQKQIDYAEAKLFVENHKPSKLVYHAMIREKNRGFERIEAHYRRGLAGFKIKSHIRSVSGKF